MSQNRWFILGGLVAGVWLLHALGPILLPFLVGGLLAYLGNPLVQRLNRIGWGRATSVAVTFLSLGSLVVTGLVLLLPRLWEQMIYLQSRIPSLLRWTNKYGIPWVEHKFHVSIDRLDMDLISQWLTTFWQGADASTTAILSHIAKSGLNVVSTVGLLALVPVVAFYLLLDWDSLLKSIRDLMPRHLEPRLVGLAKECDAVLAAFLRGQLLVMLSLGLIYGIGLQLVGLKLAMVIGLVAGLASIIPYFGFTIGIITATIVALFQYGLFWQPVLLVWLVFGIGQIMEGWVLQPYLLGDRIGLPPVGVIFAIMAGGQLFGFIGMLLALPGAAIVVVLLRHVNEHYHASRWYHGPSSDE